VLFKYQKCGVDLGICVCLYYLKDKRMRKRKLFDVILFIMGFWLELCLFLEEEKKKENSEVGGFFFLEFGDLKCGGICDFLVWKKIKGNAKKGVVVLLILGFLIEFFFQI
jgi:hypothetical protein